MLFRFRKQSILLIGGIVSLALYYSAISFCYLWYAVFLATSHSHKPTFALMWFSFCGQHPRSRKCFTLIRRICFLGVPLVHEHDHNNSCDVIFSECPPNFSIYSTETHVSPNLYTDSSWWLVLEIKSKSPGEVTHSPDDHCPQDASLGEAKG